MMNNFFIEGISDVFQIMKDEGLGKKFFLYQIGHVKPDLNLAKEIGVYGVAYERSSISKEEIKKAHEEGFRVMCLGAETRYECKDLLEKARILFKSIYLLKVVNRFNHK